MNRLILYLGTDSGTSKHRIHALRRLGHQVEVLDPSLFLPSSGILASIMGKWNFQTGALGLETYITNKVRSALSSRIFDLVWVDNGALIGPALVRELKSRFGWILNYNLDDPLGSRDANLFRLYLKAIPHYDLVVHVRDFNISEAYKAGARHALHVYRSADEIAHAPRELTDADRKRFDAEVAFVGTYMPERGPLMATLVHLGVPLTIYGNRWREAKEWPVLQSHWRPAVDDDELYPRALQCAKVCLGLVSTGNRDLHTTRSMEIPALGALLCAQRTREHEALYRDGEEAVFWSTPEECAQHCKRLLTDGRRRRSIALKGRLRCIHNGTYNEPTVARILAEIEMIQADYRKEQALRPQLNVTETSDTFADARKSAQ
jgi:spore maturation protein CgeB